MKTWEDIHGWFDFRDVYDAAWEILKNDVFDDYYGVGQMFSQTVVEVGCWLGRSVAYMASLVAQYEAPEGFHLYAVDNWRPKEGTEAERIAAQLGCRPHQLRELFEGNIQECRLARIVHPIRMESVEAAKQFEDGSVDFCFIDGDHTDCAADIKAWLPKVSKGGILAGHDIDRKDVLRDVEELLPGWEKRSVRCWWYEVK